MSWAWQLPFFLDFFYPVRILITIIITIIKLIIFSLYQFFFGRKYSKVVVELDESDIRFVCKCQDVNFSRRSYYLNSSTASGLPDFASSHPRRKKIYTKYLRIKRSLPLRNNANQQPTIFYIVICNAHLEQSTVEASGVHAKTFVNRYECVFKALHYL